MLVRLSEVGLGFLLLGLVVVLLSSLVVVLLSDVAQLVLVGTDRRGWVPFLLLLLLGWLEGVLEEGEGSGRRELFFTVVGLQLLGEEGGEWGERREGTVLSRRLGRGREEVNLITGRGSEESLLPPDCVGEGLFLTS